MINLEVGDRIEMRYKGELITSYGILVYNPHNNSYLVIDEEKSTVVINLMSLESIYEHYDVQLAERRDINVYL